MGERIALGLLWGFLLVLHVRYAFTFSVDTDEPQHLHVVWGWTQGALPYRDFFDNHAPLFSWGCAPLLRAFGERADIVAWMRLAVIPLAALCLVLTGWLGIRLLGRRAGLWAATLTGFFPVFFYSSVEFRPDLLWATLWTAALAVLCGGPLTSRRLFWFGCVLGATFATSLKTVLLVGALGLAGLLLLVIERPGGRVSWRTVTLHGAAAALGLVLVPGAFTVFFIARGAWQPFLYCLIGHNALGGLHAGAGGPGGFPFRALLLPIALPGLVLAVRGSLRGAVDPLRRQRAVLWLTAAGYPLLLLSFWPLLTRQDYLPAVPPLVLAVLSAGSIFRRWRVPPLWLLLPVGVEILGIFLIHGPWRNRLARQREFLAEALRLTRPGEFLMDAKGETIFRPRPFYFALEGIAQERLRRGLIVDDIAERLIATGTAVVHPARLPEQAKSFVEDNYLPVGLFRVLGRELPAVRGDAGRITFEVAVPARYALVGPRGLIAGTLDGLPMNGGRFLPAGQHEFIAGPTLVRDGPVALFSAEAQERGFSPFPRAPR